MHLPAPLSGEPRIFSPFFCIRQLVAPERGDVKKTRFFDRGVLGGHTLIASQKSKRVPTAKKTA
jgi:hypothetical protein